MSVGVMDVVRAIFLVMFSVSVVAQDVESSSESTSASTSMNSENSSSSPLIDLGNEYQNSITLLKNRFRIDHNVDEITMVFFREFGSSPVVLIRPDGSKLYQGRVDGERIKWFDSDTFDMITIKKPMAGPWQAVGQVLSDSRIMVVSDIELHADTLPRILFSGETLKSTAYLTNGGKPIENALFRDVVELNIDFISTNNSDYDNFGANDQHIATFEDNGRDMDERPNDGIFTGKFNLQLASGEWCPVYRVKTPMFTRERIADPIVLYPNPIKIDVDLAQNNQEYHTLFIDADRDLVAIESLVVDGKIKYPNGDLQSFSITDDSAQARQFQIVAYEEGIFRVNLTVFGNSADGREFMLDVPEFTFLAEAPEPEVIDPLVYGEDPVIDGSEESPSLDEDNAIADAPEIDVDEETMDSDTLIFLIVLVNGAIIIVGIIAAVVIIHRRRKGQFSSKNKGTVSAKKVVSEEDLLLDNEPKGVKKLMDFFKK